jgi:hypothetical protein
MMKMNFTPALSPDVVTHKQGNQLDQVYTKNLSMVNAVINDSLDHSLTDHWCIKVTLKPQQTAQRPRALVQHNPNYKSGDHSTLKQGTIRGLVNLE